MNTLTDSNLAVTEQGIYYRIANIETEQGLWYDREGKFTGLIHNEFDFCKNNSLAMDYDEELKGWLSAADSLENLYQWFPVEDIIRLQEHGYRILVYENDNVKWYDKFQHWVIHQETSYLKAVITL